MYTLQNGEDWTVVGATNPGCISFGKALQDVLLVRIGASLQMASLLMLLGFGS